MRKSVQEILVLLLVVVSFTYGRRVVFPTIENIEEVPKLQIDRKGSVAFLRGFSEGLDQQVDFSGFEKCIVMDDDIIDHIANAIHYFRGKTRESIEKAFIELAQAVSVIPRAIENCKEGVVDVQTLIEMLEIFDNPGKFFWVIAKNLVVHGVDIWYEVSNAIEEFKVKNYFDSGELFGLASCKIFFDSKKGSTLAMVNSLNAMPNMSWEATSYPMFENMSLWEIKHQFTSLKSLKPLPWVPVDDTPIDTDSIPGHFDARQKWEQCVQPIRFQGHCNSGWAFGASEVLGDRYCILTNRTVRTVLSPQYLVSCNKMNHGCRRGCMAFAWWFLALKGTVSEKCWPYESGSGRPPSCRSFTKCEDESDLHFYKAKLGTVKTYLGKDRIKMEILRHGPVETGFLVFQDFLTYKKGIYHRTSGRLVGIHSAKIVGWGVQEHLKYWIVANSWSNDWGENGYFRIKEGEGLIDFAAMAGLPLV